MYLRTEGVVLKRKNFGEADRLLTIYTRDFGKITCIAKGVKRPKSRKAGHIELGSWCKIFVAKGKNLDLLTEVEVKKAFGIENFSEDKANKIYHLLELVDLLTPSHQKNPMVLSLLVQYLDIIEKENNYNLISSVFKVKLLSILGFFSSQSLKNQKTKNFFEMLQEKNLQEIKSQFKLKEETYLKLLSFLDSIIEKIIETNLKTSRFVNGPKH